MSNKPVKDKDSAKHTRSECVHKPLKPIHQAFVHNYANPNSDTYSNASQSLLKANPNITPRSARAMTAPLLANPSIQDAIIQHMEDMGCGDKVRSAKLADIIKGRYVSKTETEQIVDGQIVSTSRVKKTPHASDIIKAIDTVNKMSGIYDQSKAKAETMSKTMTELFKRSLQAKDKGDKGRGE